MNQQLQTHFDRIDRKVDRMTNVLLWAYLFLLFILISFNEFWYDVVYMPVIGAVLLVLLLTPFCVPYFLKLRILMQLGYRCPSCGYMPLLLGKLEQKMILNANHCHKCGERLTIKECDSVESEAAYMNHLIQEEFDGLNDDKNSNLIYLIWFVPFMAKSLVPEV